MNSKIQQFFPALAIRNKQCKAVWLEYATGINGISLVTGKYENGKLTEVNRLATDLNHFLEPKIEFIDDETYLVALSCNKDFKLKFWLCRTNDDQIIKSEEVAEKCGAFAFAQSSRGTVTVWESWSKEGNATLKCSLINNDGNFDSIRDLTPEGVSIAWPSAVVLDNTLWVSFCVPNSERTGYDCILLADSGNKTNYWQLNNGNSLYNLYPELSVDGNNQLWITWIRETEQEYYNLIDRIADSTYCCRQDPRSRAHRKILWNATEPMVMQLERGQDKVIGTRYALNSKERGENENQTIHYPSLHFIGKSSPIMVFDQIHLNRFQTRYRTIGNETDKFLQTEITDNKCHLLAQPTKCRTAFLEHELLFAQEVAKIEKGKRRNPESHIEIISNHIDSSVNKLKKLCKLTVEPIKLTIPTSRQKHENIALGNIHVHTEMSSCRRDTQQSLDFNYRWGKDLLEQKFIAMTDHIQDITPGQWHYCLSLVDFFNFPNHYVALPSYEWAQKAPDGHVNVLFPNINAALSGYTDKELQNLEELWNFLEETPALTIAHHTGTAPMNRDWSQYHQSFEPLVEIFQDRRGNFEYPASPWIPGEGCPEQGVEKKVLDGFVDEALRRGYKLGFCSGGDHMGLSMTGVYTSNFSSEDLYQLFKSRDCFAVTRANISINIKALDGDKSVTMGQTLITGAENLKIQIKAQADSEIEYVAIIHDAREYCRIPGHSESTIETTIDITEPVKYLYARLMLKDKNIAWSSPIWLEKP